MKELSVTDDARSARPRSESLKGSFEDQGKTVLEMDHDEDVMVEDDDADQRSAPSHELNQLDQKQQAMMTKVLKSWKRSRWDQESPNPVELNSKAPCLSQ